MDSVMLSLTSLKLEGNTQLLPVASLEDIIGSNTAAGDRDRGAIEDTAAAGFVTVVMLAQADDTERSNGHGAERAFGRARGEIFDVGPKGTFGWHM